MNIALFGGAFNPPHNEHLKVISEAKKALNLDQCVIFPSYLPPHKRTADGTPFELRVKMCELAFPDCVVSKIEKESSDVNYAVNTVKKFQELYKGDKLFYIIGGDSMADIFKWYKPEILFSLVDIVVYPREGRIKEMYDAIARAREMGAKIHLINVMSDNVSSGEIRYLSAISANLEGLVSLEVERFIKNNLLYTTSLTEILNARLNERTYLHSIRTAIWAMKLNRKLALPIKDVFEASLLHDVAKDDAVTDGVPTDAVGSPVAHQFRGAKVLKDMGFNDDVVQAVAYHTTGCKNMNMLQKLIFCADMTEEGRKFDGVEELRNSLLKDFQLGFKACLKRTYQFLIEKGADIYPLTKDAYLFYLDK